MNTYPFIYSKMLNLLKECLLLSVDHIGKLFILSIHSFEIYLSDNYIVYIPIVTLATLSLAPCPLNNGIISAYISRFCTNNNLKIYQEINVL